MAALVIPMFGNEALSDEREDWKAGYLSFINVLLEELLKGLCVEKLSDITSTLFRHKADILGQMVLTFIRKRHGALLEQEYCHCPECNRVLKSRGKHKRAVETMTGQFELERPYFYCTHCSLGMYPLDEALGLSQAVKQDDVQSVGVFLATELPYELASETYERCTGSQFSDRSLHQSVNRVAEGLDVLDVCPSKAEVEEKIARIAEGKRWRPIMMMTVDGAQEPVRPEPSPRKRKKGQRRLEGGERVSHLPSGRGSN